MLILAVGTAILIAVFTLVWLQSAKYEPLAVGKPAPDFSLTDLNDKQYRLSDFRGKVVFLNFWATWCKPCQREIPAFNTVYEEYKDKGVEFYGVLQEDYDPNAVLNFASDHYMTYPIVPIDDAIARQFGMAPAIPTTFIYDKKGARRENHTGPLEEYELREILDRLLAE